jgi:hypothetical protein
MVRRKGTSIWVIAALLFLFLRNISSIYSKNITNVTTHRTNRMSHDEFFGNNNESHQHRSSIGRSNDAMYTTSTQRKQLSLSYSSSLSTKDSRTSTRLEQPERRRRRKRRRINEHDRAVKQQTKDGNDVVRKREDIEHVLVTMLRKQHQLVLQRLLDTMNYYTCLSSSRTHASDREGSIPSYCSTGSQIGRELQESTEVVNDETASDASSSIVVPTPVPTSSTYAPTISMLPTYTEKCYVCPTADQVVAYPFQQFEFMNGYITSCGEIEYVGKHFLLKK